MWRNQFNAGGIKCSEDTYCSYESEHAGYAALEDLLKEYVHKYGYNLEAIRDRYCGDCGSDDLKTFTEIYMEELER